MNKEWLNTARGGGPFWGWSGSTSGSGQISADVCEACAGGKYSTSGPAQTSEDVCTECGLGTYSAAVGAGTNGADTNPCEGTGTNPCETCDPGQYADTTGSTACKLCKPGRYLRIDRNDNEPSDHASEDKCKVCGEDEYQPLAGQKSCEDCRGNRVIEDRKDPDKHINASQCYEKGAVAPCSAGKGRSLNVAGQETECEGKRRLRAC